MRPLPNEVLHFSEDPTVTVFVPQDEFVWAVDHDRCPDYWFPRECPRAMAWLGPTTTTEDADRILGPGVTRVHAIEYAWLERIQSVKLYAYRLPAERFRHVEGGHAMVCTETVAPLGPPLPVGDLLGLHERAGVQTRLVGNLWPWWDLVVDSTVEFSGIRLRNAHARVVDHGLVTDRAARRDPAPYPTSLPR